MSAEAEPSDVSQLKTHSTAAEGDSTASVLNSEERRKVIIAVDESDESMSALSWALDNVVHKNSDKIHLLHVQPPSKPYSSPIGAGMIVIRL